ncbi:protein translocase subunit [Arachnomyces sp. PD_36]|nr:protein translocase subunit [Arachnomyces sp. PD_36]
MSLSSDSGSSAEMKTKIINQVQAEAAMNNARTLVQKLNEHCFDKCISTPQSSLSSRDESCLNMCFQKYVGTWNLTSRAYVARLGKENAGSGMGGIGGL